MAARSVWRGHLRLALVSCPVALHPARRAAGALHFHYINPKTGHRVRMMTLDAGTDEELARSDLVKGYEYKKNHYLVMTKEDFENARIESSTTMTVDKLIDARSLDPIYYDSSYYLLPDGEAGQDVYGVLREAMRETGRLALSRIVIAGRERTVGILPLDNGLVVHTLLEPRELYDRATVFDDIPDTKPDPEMVKLAVQLMDRQTGRYDPSDIEDRYETRLRAVIEAKLRGEGIEPEAEAEADRGNVVDLMAALKQSLARKAGETPIAGPGTSRPPKPAGPTRKTARKPIHKRA